MIEIELSKSPLFVYPKMHEILLYFHQLNVTNDIHSTPVYNSLLFIEDKFYSFKFTTKMKKAANRVGSYHSPPGAIGKGLDRILEQIHEDKRRTETQLSKLAEKDIWVKWDKLFKAVVDLKKLEYKVGLYFVSPTSLAYATAHRSVKDTQFFARNPPNKLTEDLEICSVSFALGYFKQILSTMGLEES